MDLRKTASDWKNISAHFHFSTTLNHPESAYFFLLHPFLSVLGFIIFERNAFDIVPNRESNS